jgi:uncharacterized protein (TIGR03437 family)
MQRSALSLLLLCAPAFGQQNALVVQDIFGRVLNQTGITMVDWDGYMANPAIKFFVVPPANAQFPATAVLTANEQRLYFDLPSTVGANGPSKTISFPNASARVSVYLGNAPDRDSADGFFQLKILFTAADKQTSTLTLPIHEIDQDQQTAAPYKITVDFSQDKTSFFDSPTNRTPIQQELADWSYFFDDMNLDAVPAGRENTFIWNSDGFVSGKVVANTAPYTGTLLYVYGIHSSALRSGGEPSSQGGFQTSGGIALPLRRSGGMEVETAGNYNSIGWLTSVSDSGWWVSANLGNELNELFSITHHESGHALAFNPNQTNFARFKANGCVNDPAVMAYHNGVCPKIDASDHFNGEIDDNSLFGAFGNEYNGRAPARRWFITKLDLLLAQAVGWKLRQTSAFIPVSISTGSVPVGVMGQPYAQSLAAQGGIPFYNWTVASGALPDGLQLDSFSGAISGTPTRAGSFTFTVRLQEYVEISPGVTKELAIVVGAAPTPLPVITAAGAVNSASYISSGVAPGEMLTLFGSNLGPTDLTGLQLTGGKVATSLGGVRVLFDGIPAPMVLASASQLNVIVPYEVQVGTSIQVEYGGVRSAAVVMPVVPSFPAIFAASGGKGQGAILNQDYSYNSSAVPAAAGSVVALYLTGAGQTQPAGVDGFVPGDAAGLSLPVLPVTAQIGGLTAQVLYAGTSVGIVNGAIQVNLLVPPGLSPGDQPVVVRIGSVESQPGVTVAVR